MSELRELLDEFIALVQSGRTTEAMERFYTEDVVVFENRELARAGREACIRYEQERQAALSEAPTLRALSSAVDQTSGRAFIEWSVRFVSESGREMLLEEVAVQRWTGRQIDQERFYYEGFVDEGPAEVTK